MSALGKTLVVLVALGAAAHLANGGSFDGLAADADERPSSSTARADIPSTYYRHYRAVARSSSTCSQLDWSLLAAIGKVETDHGRTRLPGVHSGSNSAGARGPMQFLPATFADVRARHGDVGPDVYDPRTAIRAAAHYLCDSGLARDDDYAAIYAYNHARWYVAKVQRQAARYR